jgi:Flp pilus assembly pilin Flp
VTRVRRHHRDRWGPSERGAAAVEFALVLMLLVVLVGGIVDLGLAFNAQVSLTHAAREGVRVEAIGTGDPLAAAQNAFSAPGVGTPTPILIAGCPNSTNTARLTMRATYNYVLLRVIGLNTVTLTSTGVMRCGG